jgi:hypothetical protein
MSHTLQISSTASHLGKICIAGSLVMFIHKSYVACNLGIHNELERNQIQQNPKECEHWFPLVIH